MLVTLFEYEGPERSLRNPSPYTTNAKQHFFVFRKKLKSKERAPGGQPQKSRRRIHIGRYFAFPLLNRPLSVLTLHHCKTTLVLLARI